MSRPARTPVPTCIGVLLAASIVGGLAACSGSGSGQFDPTSTRIPASSTSTAVVVSSTPSSSGIPGLPVDVPALPVSSAAVTVAQPQPAAGACHASGSGDFVLPDPRCTPGAVSAAVTPATLTSTVCTPTWGATVVRPSGPVLYTEAKESKAAYSFPAQGGRFAYGYVVPLQLGGAANDERNAWPVSAVVATQRNQLEARLISHVCDGSLSLAAAQYLMAADFLNAYTQFVGPLAQATAARPEPGTIAVVGAACSPAGEIAADSKGGLAECTATGGLLIWQNTG